MDRGNTHIMRLATVLLALAAVTAGCEGLEQSLLLPDISLGSTTEDGSADLAVFETTARLDEVAVEPEVYKELVFDVTIFESLEPGCLPGEGCFLDKCDENGDCQSGWCVEHMGDGVCTMNCQEECPPGWACKQVAGTDPDLVFVCVSSYANLCKPCASGDNCKGLGGADDVCVDYGEEGSFCGGECESDGDCPWGFVCLEAATTDGVMLNQCVAEAGTCPCTDKSIALGLFAPCEMANGHGICVGKRVCTDDGLSPCDAVEPAVDVCNGEDDDCDGSVDEPLEVGGDYVSPCDDGNDCTEDICNGVDGCEQVALSQAECKDGNPCTVADHCEEGVCIGSLVDCDDGNPCTDDACNETGGCIFTHNMADCDDGDPCTLGDECEEGVCEGVVVPCDCQSDDDCAALEDGDLCNGTLYCDTAQLPYQCTVLPGTEVDCPAPEGPDAPCQAVVCDPATGQCGLDQANDGAPCEDGDLCSLGDQCEDGLCTSGVPVNCNDGDPCTDDNCEPDQGCAHSFNQAPCTDGDVCTTGDKCLGGLCLSKGTLDCDDLNECTDDLCDALEGCLHAANEAACSDGNACTSGDQCQGGKCLFSGALDCDDDNVCTTDSCDPLLGCVHALNDAPCNDGNLCTLGDFCHLGACNGAAQLNCNDSNPCTDDECNKTVGCTHMPNQEPCDDGNECTSNDACSQGTCKAGSAVICDDDNVCTTDYCDPLLGCVTTHNQAPCNDGDACTVGDACALGACEGPDPLDCDDGNLCTDDSCDPLAGCFNVNNSLPCDDGNACTEDEVCAGGKCGGGFAIVCDDNNICTDDTCDLLDGCTYASNTAPCDDDDECTVGDECLNNACQSGSNLECNDGNDCTEDSCDPAQGCLYAPIVP